MKRATHKPSKRVLILLDFVGKKLAKDPGGMTVFFALPEVASFNRALSDRDGLETALDEINGNNSIKTEVIPGKEEKVSEGTSGHTTKKIEPTRYKVHVGDPDKFKLYKKETSETLKNDKLTAQFVLERESGNLYRKDLGRSGPVREMRKHAFPYKLLVFLHKAKTFVKTQEIASKFSIKNKEGEVDAVQTRHKINEKVKAPISEQFGVSRDALIENEGNDEGYRVKNLEVV